MREDKFIHLLSAGFRLEMSATTAFGIVHFEIHRRSGEEKRTMFIRRCVVNMEKLRQCSELTYEGAQDMAVCEATDMLQSYKLPYLEVQYATPFM